MLQILENLLDCKEMKPVNLKYSLEELMLKLKLQYFGYLIQRAHSLEKTLMVGKIEGKRRMGWQWTGWLDGITDSMGMSLRKLRKMAKGREAWHVAAHGVTKSQMWMSDRTTKYFYFRQYFLVMFLYCKYHLQICSLTLNIVFDIFCNTNSFYYKKMPFVICELCLNMETIFFSKFIQLF